MIRSGGITQGDLAARFVSTYSEQKSVRSIERNSRSWSPANHGALTSFPEDDGPSPWKTPP